MRRLSPILMFSIVLAAGCGDEHSHAETSPATSSDEACEHLADGPFQSVQASLSGETLANAAFEHTRVNIGLVDVSQSKGGEVSFEADADGDFYLYLSANVPLKVLNGSGAEVPFESTTVGSDSCTDIAVTHVVELTVGTYILQFGPTTETEVGLVHELAGAEHIH